MRKIKKAIKELNDNPEWLTLAGEECCSSCSTAEIASRQKNKPEAIHYAFYHKQDAEFYENDKKLYIGFGTLLPVSSAEENEAKTKIAGEALKKYLTDYGLTVEWDGDPNRRMLVS